MYTSTRYAGRGATPRNNEPARGRRKKSLILFFFARAPPKARRHAGAGPSHGIAPALLSSCSPPSRPPLFAVGARHGHPEVRLLHLSISGGERNLIWLLSGMLCLDAQGRNSWRTPGRSRGFEVIGAIGVWRRSGRSPMPPLFSSLFSFLFFLFAEIRGFPGNPAPISSRAPQY